MMTPKEIQNLFDQILLQVNQAFGRKDEEIAELKRRVEALENAPAKKTTTRKAA